MDPDSIMNDLSSCEEYIQKISLVHKKLMRDMGAQQTPHLAAIRSLFENSTNDFVKSLSLGPGHNERHYDLFNALKMLITEFETISDNYEILYSKYMTIKESNKSTATTPSGLKSTKTPKKPSKEVCQLEQANFKYNEDTPSKKKKDRSKMQGASCACCSPYYEMMKESVLREGENDVNCVNQCDGYREDSKAMSNSRHRYVHPPPSTPPGYWDIEFSDPNIPSTKADIDETGNNK